MLQTALITGGSRGIGRAAAKALAENGYRVIINYNNSEKQANELKNELNSKGLCAEIFKADVSNRQQVEKMFEFAEGVDLLVNNAGIAEQILFSDITEEKWKRIFDVNVNGVFNCCQCALPYMIHNKKGKIINISSIWGITGASCEVHYSATKAAIIGFTKALAKELGPSGITVNCIAPGVIATEMNGNLSEETIEELKEETPLGVIGAPEDIADTVLFLAKNSGNFITGQVISPNGGFLI